MASSPHTRGSTYSGGLFSFTESVFPAHAGIDLVRLLLEKGTVCLAAHAGIDPT